MRSLCPPSPSQKDDRRRTVLDALLFEPRHVQSADVVEHAKAMVGWEAYPAFVADIVQPDAVAIVLLAAADNGTGFHWDPTAAYNRALPRKVGGRDP